MIYPKFIKENDTIGVPAPSAGANNELKINKYKNAYKKLNDLGYNLILSDNLYSNINGRSEVAIKRAEEINNMFSNKDIDLLLCAAGGEFLVEILPYIDFNLIKNNIKYICGFSDPTGLLYPITTKLDIATIYGKNFSNFGMEPYHKSEEDFLKIISGNDIIQSNYEMYEEEPYEKTTGLEGYNLNGKVNYKTTDNKDVDVTGRIIGGCFDIIAELAGTKYDGINDFNERYKEDGIIWYFDNCELSMEETIRVLWKFNELGYFKYTKCIIFGRFGINKSYLDYDVESCIKDSVISKLKIPIIFDADISHKGPSLNIINGSIANVSLSNKQFKITFKLM